MMRSRHYRRVPAAVVYAALVVLLPTSRASAAGAPVAVLRAVPNPGIVGGTISLDCSLSFHQDPARMIDSWEWDIGNPACDDDFNDASGPVVTTTFAAQGSYCVKCRVTDDGSPEQTATATGTVLITSPPIAPTADADGPYQFCPEAKPWFLDATGSVNPDEGQSEPGSRATRFRNTPGIWTATTSSTTPLAPSPTSPPSSRLPGLAPILCSYG